MPNSVTLRRRRVRMRRAMKVRSGGLNRLALLFLASVVLLFDAVVIGRHIGLIALPGEMNAADLARSGAAAYIEQAVGALDPGSEAVLVAATWGQMLKSARTVEDVGRLLAAGAGEVAQAAEAHRTAAARERLAKILADDPRVGAYNRDTPAYILVTPHGSDSGVQDRQGALSADTVALIEQDPIIARSAEAIELTVSAGRVSFEPGDPALQVRALSAEVEALQAALATARMEAGLVEMEGPGVVIAAYDAPQAWSFQEIVHERDVGSILNAVFSAGALGAQVGGERIVATSSVRCIGPVVLVNQRPVAVNPVTVVAIGDPDRIEQSLKPIAVEFARVGKLLEVRRESLVRIEAYRRVGA
jgi:hypothetical protein